MLLSIILSSFPALSDIFDVVIAPAPSDHLDAVVGLTSKFLELLKPGGRFYLYVSGNEENRKQLEVNLLIAGFVNIASNDAPFKLQLENSTEELNLPECVKDLVCIFSEKPNYEVSLGAFCVLLFPRFVKIDREFIRRLARQNLYLSQMRKRMWPLSGN
mgnify:CR=1 FL=1